MRKFAIFAVQYGTSPASQDLPVAEPGGPKCIELPWPISEWSKAVQSCRGPPASLLGQIVYSNYSIVSLDLGYELPKPVLVVEWVVEAESRLWIVQIVHEWIEGATPLPSCLICAM